MKYLGVLLALLALLTGCKNGRSNISAAFPPGNIYVACFDGSALVDTQATKAFVDELKTKTSRQIIPEEFPHLLVGQEKSVLEREKLDAAHKAGAAILVMGDSTATRGLGKIRNATAIRVMRVSDGATLATYSDRQSRSLTLSDAEQQSASATAKWVAAELAKSL